MKKRTTWLFFARRACFLAGRETGHADQSSFGFVGDKFGRAQQAVGDEMLMILPLFCPLICEETR